MENQNLAIFLPSNYQASHPSMRLRRCNLRKPLRLMDIKADLIFRYEDLWQYSNILISHLDKTVAEHCHRWRCEGRRLFYDHTEGLWGLNYQEEIFNLCDYIVCCSTKLAEMTQAQLKSKFTKCIVIPDMLEGPRPIHEPKEKEKLCCAWVGMGGNSYLVKNLKPIIESCGMDLLVISEHEDADLKWNRDTYLYDMAEKADIVLCPQNVERQPAKSHVKVATAMGLGMPLVCSPNPAYLEIVENGVNGFVARNSNEWAEALNKLKDFKLRKQMGEHALETSKQFNSESIAKLWVNLLDKDETKFSVAFINNTLPHKYVSYGDIIIDNMRLNGIRVTEFRYEDISSLPHGYDVYIFTEVRFNPEEISYVVHHPLRGRLSSDGGPRILITKEDIDLNHLAHFDLIVTPNRGLGEKWINRGFVNIEIIENWNDIDPEHLASLVNEDNFLAARKKHNFDLHSQHIDVFHHLQLPEDRWKNGIRDIEHIKFSINNTEVGSRVLDVGSADGWLSLYLAKEGRKVSAVDFVKRGMEWTRQHAIRLGVEIDLHYGFIEEIDKVFKNQKFDCILIYELLEHLDFLKIPFYLKKIESLLYPKGKILISLPCQNLVDNNEHLWSPNEKLIKKSLSNKLDFDIKWVEFPNSNVSGNWFISYIVD